MENIIETVKKEVFNKCIEYEEKHNYDIWNCHIKHVIKNAVNLAEIYGADREIVELGAILHDVAKVFEFGPREEHHIYGAKLTDEILTKLNYPEERKSRVKECVLKHSGGKDLKRNTIEEECVADGDVIAKFDCIPALFHYVYYEKRLTVSEGEEYLRKKLKKDFDKLSQKTQILVKNRYEDIVNLLFVSKE